MQFCDACANYNMYARRIERNYAERLDAIAKQAPDSWQHGQGHVEPNFLFFTEFVENLQKTRIDLERVPLDLLESIQSAARYTNSWGNIRIPSDFHTTTHEQDFPTVAATFKQYQRETVSPTRYYRSLAAAYIKDVGPDGVKQDYHGARINLTLELAWAQQDRSDAHLGKGSWLHTEMSHIIRENLPSGLSGLPIAPGVTLTFLEAFEAEGITLNQLPTPFVYSLLDLAHENACTRFFFGSEGIKLPRTLELDAKLDGYPQVSDALQQMRGKWVSFTPHDFFANIAAAYAEDLRAIGAPASAPRNPGQVAAATRMAPVHQAFQTPSVLRLPTGFKGR